MIDPTRSRTEDATATDSRSEEPPAELDLNSSPFELQEIERLPLTKEQRAALRQLIAKFDREREAAAKAKA